MQERGDPGEPEYSVQKIESQAVVGVLVPFINCLILYCTFK